MRVRAAVGVVAWLWGCSETALVPAPPDAPKLAASPSAEEPAAPPTHPTPAFMPRDNGSCSRDYKLVSETCVHRYYEQSHPGDMERALTAYKRGAAPPMLGPVPTRAPVAAPKSHTLDPGALTKRSEADAEKARERRLAELDEMLAAAREKIRQRDEAGKAKSVANAPKQEAESGRANEPVLAGRAATNGTAAGDPAAARLNELSQLAGQLSGEQLQSLMAELGKSGINTSALNDLLKREQGQQPPGL